MANMKDHKSEHWSKKRKKEKGKERVEKSKRIWSKQAKVHTKCKLMSNSSSDCVDTEKKEELVKRKKNRKNSAEDRKHATDQDHKSMKRKHFDENHSENTVKKRKIIITGDCKQEDSSVQASYRDIKRKTKKHKKCKKIAEHSKKSEQTQNHAYRLDKRHQKRQEMHSQAKKNTSNKAEYDKFILENDLIHYVWNPSKELEKHFGFRKGKWTRDEERILKENMTKFIQQNNIDDPMELVVACRNETPEKRKKWREFTKATGFYQHIAKGIKRSLHVIYHKFNRTFDRNNYLGYYSRNEDDKLLKFVALYGTKWSKIGLMIGRSRLSVFNRYYDIKNRSSYNVGPWQDDEVNRLKKAVRQVTNTQDGEEVYHGINWLKVHSIVRTRSYDKCRQKWLREVCWKDCNLNSRNKKTWSHENDVELISRIYESRATEECDVDWLALGEEFDMVCSPFRLRGKFSVIKRKYCKSIDCENSDFDDVIDYLYNIVAVDIQNKVFQDQEERAKK